MENENQEQWQPPGRRVRFWRELAGMSQQELADRVDRTQGWVSQVESLRVSLDSRTTVDALAKALGVSRNDITGEPVPARTADDMAAFMSVQQVRQALTVPDEPTKPRDFTVLFDMSDQAMKARMNCDYGRMGSLLAPLLADANVLYDSGDHRDKALQLLVQASVTGALAFKPLGYIDLAQRLADRALTAALELGDPVYRAAAEYVEAQCVFAVGTSKEQSLRIAARAADRLEQDGDGDDGAAGWRTMLHLHAALSAAALHRDDLAQDHLVEAQQAVRGVSTARNPWHMEPTPDNVGTWAVGIAAEGSNPERVVQLALRVNPRGLLTTQRQSRLHMDYARGLFRTGQFDAAVGELLTAHDIAPSDIGRRPMVREMTSYMVRTASRRGGSAELQDLARKVGVGPETLAVAA